MDLTTATDSDLLRAWVQHRHEPAFRALVQRYAALVHRSALRTCADETLAAETAQLVFLLLHKKAPSLTARASLAGWLHTTALLQAKNLLRQSRREHRKRHQLHASLESDRQSPLPAATSWEEVAPRLDKALASLPDKDRETLLLRFYRSLSIQQIAGTLGIATDAAQKRLDRATARLRRHLTRRATHSETAPEEAFGGLLLSGFASDMESHTPALPDMTSRLLKAMSPAAPPSVVPAQTWTAMKVAAIATPSLALALSATILLRQHLNITDLNNMVRGLENTSPPAAKELRFPSLAVMDSTSGKSDEGQSKSDPDINWETLCAHFSSKKSSLDDPDGATQWTLLNRRLPQMNAEELLRAFAAVAAIGEALPREESFEVMYRVADLLLERLCQLDPLTVLDTYGARLTNPGQYSVYNNQLPRALECYAARDFAAAAAWLDRQNAAGRFDSKSLDAISRPQVALEAALLKVQLKTGSEGRIQRLAVLPEAVRQEIFKTVALALDPAQQPSFARTVRDTFSPETAPLVLAQSVAPPLTRNGFKPLDDFLSRIDATADERLACVGEAASCQVSSLLQETPDRAAQLDSIRQWIANQFPDQADTLTARALARLAAHPKDGALRVALTMVLQLAPADNGSVILESFLKSPEIQAKREPIIALAKVLPASPQRAALLSMLEINP